MIVNILIAIFILILIFIILTIIFSTLRGNNPLNYDEFYTALAAFSILILLALTIVIVPTILIIATILKIIFGEPLNIIPQIGWYLLILFYLIFTRYGLTSFILKKDNEKRLIDKAFLFLNFIIIFILSINVINGNHAIVKLIENNTLYTACITYIAFNE